MMLRLLFACLFATAYMAAPCLAAPGAVAPDDAKLSVLEVKYFSHPYTKESEPDRIGRIERMVFGVEQSGSIEDRLARLESSANAPSVTETMPPLTPRAQKPERVSTLKSVDDANIPDSSSYPRVAELEQTLLGRAYTGDSVRERLDRLETKAFGHPSSVVDLAARVDNLNEYAAAFTVPENRRNGLDFGGLRASTTSAGQSQTKFVGVVDQIEALETSVYGAKRTNKPLLQRVSSLEGSVYGASRDQSNDDLTTRVSHLWASVKPTAPSLSSLQGFGDAPTQDWRNQQNQLAQMQQQSQTPVYQTASHHSSQSQPHHSFLKKIGKAMQVATSLAVTAVGSAAMGGYGYPMGMGYGYNGFNSGFSGLNSGFSPMGSAYGFGGPAYFNGFR